MLSLVRKNCNTCFVAIIAIGILSVITLECSAKKVPVPKPNIILIMVDDLGYEAIGSYGGTSYNTPNINKLAATGIQFNHAYAQPLCAPTRLEIMTGKYNFRNWTAFGIMDPAERTFGHLMQEAGYGTCITGKWQLQSYDPLNYPGSAYRRNTGMKVEHAGFDEYSIWHAGHTEDKRSRYADPTIFENGKFLADTKGKYGPDLFSDFLNDYVNRQSNKPFFAYYPMVLTHNPFSPTPDSKIWKNQDRRFDEDTAYFKDMVEYTDKMVGKIMANLEAHGLLEETLVLFYADNGTHNNIYSRMGSKVVRGGKGLTIETGIKVPLIASWKGHIKEGTVTNEMVSAIDFLPTIMEAAGAAIPAGFHSDGQSFLPVMQGKTSHRKDWVFMNYHPMPGWDKDQFAPTEFVMNHQYKYYGDGRFYDIKNEPMEHDTLPANRLLPKMKRVRDRFKSIVDSLKKYPSFGSIERLDPALDSIVSKHARIELIARGFNWSEGPVWQPNGQKLLFSDVPENKIYQWNNLSGLSLYLSPSGYTGSAEIKGGKGSNGLTIDLKGQLVLCQQGDRVISRLSGLADSLHPLFEPVVTNYKGKKLNAPNDLVYDRNGNLYFTDPSFGPAGQKSELGYNGVYFFSKKEKLVLLDDQIKAPNGIGVSNDNKTLYVSDSDPEYPKLWAFDILGDGLVDNKRILFDATSLRKASISKQSPDGLKIDKNGNIFLAGPDGILVLSPTGKHLGTIRTDKKTGNCAFNDDGRYLFITCDDYLLRVDLRPYSK